jgi:hypothetical protein
MRAAPTSCGFYRVNPVSGEVVVLNASLLAVYDHTQRKKEASVTGTRVRMHWRAEMIRDHAVGASRNDVDFVYRIPATQPIRITENLCRPEYVEGPPFLVGHPKVYSVRCEADVVMTSVIQVALESSPSPE